MMAGAALALLPLSVTAQEPGADPATAPMTAAEFDAHVTGRSLAYSVGGATYAVEAYRPGRRVLWSVGPGECEAGVWFPRDDEICFRYEVIEGDRCWRFRRDGDGLVGRFTTNPDDARTYRATPADPPDCPGAVPVS